MKVLKIKDSIIIITFVLLIMDLIVTNIRINNIDNYERTDVNHDGVTDIRDLTIVQKRIVEGR